MWMLIIFISSASGPVHPPVILKQLPKKFLKFQRECIAWF